MSSDPSASSIALVWFRQDLRVSDNSALNAAIESGLPLLPLYIFDQQNVRALGGASQWWLHESLKALHTELETLGTKLHIVAGSTQQVFDRVVANVSVKEVFANRCYEADAAELEQTIYGSLSAKDIHMRRYSGALLFEPEQIHKDDGLPYKVFTPFYKRSLSRLSPGRELTAPPPLSDRQKQSPCVDCSDTVTLESLELLPTQPDWSTGLRATWTPGEQGAEEQLDVFIHNALHNYKLGRDIPADDGTSMLSPHLHFGEITPRSIWHKVEQAMAVDRKNREGGIAYLRELVWRDFAYYLLHHWPTMVSEPFRPDFKHFPWADNAQHLKAWQRGQTGYPLVDAGMRQLWQTGWMHNRVRMVVASFLVKHLLQHWKQGEEWFWDTLVDADLASNTASWQWAAGSGADAAPYFRIFNPTLQSTRFDKQGDYIRLYVPELAALPAKYIHEPHKAPDKVLKEAGVRLGENYPLPMVDHREARERALASFRSMPGKESS